MRAGLWYASKQCGITPGTPIDKIACMVEATTWFAARAAAMAHLGVFEPTVLAVLPMKYVPKPMKKLPVLRP